MKISPARLAAFDILFRIETERAFSSVLLPFYAPELADNDRGLCHELVLGPLRRRMYLDRIIDQAARGKTLDVAVRIVLRLGIYQLLFLDKIPAYSAINESVNLIQKAKKTSAKGFVNAILRRVSEKVPALEFADEVERVSVETSHPRWLLEKWISEFGAGEAYEIARANNVIPAIAFRSTARSDGVTALQNVKASEFVDGCFLASKMNDELRRLSESGEIYFQDEASQMVAQAAYPKPGESFLDVCAAPGSKTTQISEHARNALLVAGDVNASRIGFLASNCLRQGVGRVNFVQYDAEISLPFADKSFDVVLVDAPCSGTGTIRHNPEIRYFLERDVFAELSGKQQNILRNASKMVRPGGRLLYSTCSIELEENEAVCFSFAEASPNFLRAGPKMPKRFATGEGFARTFPHRDGTDGFFLAEFSRVPADREVS